MQNSQFITVVEAEQNGISMDAVEICKEIRKLAKLNRLLLDESMHRSGLNKHLFSYIEYCGMDVKDYIKGYLSNLQPFMIERFQSQKPDNNYICVLDNLYRISLYIKNDKTFGNEIIVSFHENNKRGIAKENNMLTYDSNRPVAVFADEILARTGSSSREEIKIFIQRGMLLLPIQIIGQKCENGTYIVNMRDIEILIIDCCNQYLRDLYTSDLKLEALDKIEIFSVLYQISFTSYGNNVFSNISLLIDNMAIQNGIIGKKVADFALVTYVDHLMLDEMQINELSELINEKYKVRSQKNIDLILNRIKDILDTKVLQFENQDPPAVNDKVLPQIKHHKN
jgi:hypothetical protein